ncbi:MAG: insulinase family protein [candidate division Zixibacteria bacterium]|nr:insulinase family protein [candidate division Zixibacteria bacterium]
MQATLTLSNSTYRKTILPNGLRVISQSMTGVRSVSLGVWVWAGARFEPANKSGIAHFLEHMVFKGTPSRSAYQIARSIESIGGHLNAFTGKELNCFFASVLDQHLPVAVEVLGDILMHSHFETEGLKRERKVVIDEIKGLEDTPDDLVNEVFMSLVWNPHPLSRVVLGDEAAVSSFTRRDVKAYLRRRYCAPYMYVTAAGQVDHEQLVSLIRDQYDFPAAGPTPSPAAPPAMKGHRSVLSRDIAQAYVCYGGPALSFDDPRKYALFVLNTLLGGGMTSRLFQKIREDAGLAYSIFSDVDFCVDTGLISVGVGTDAQDVNRVLEMVRHEFEDLRHHPLGEDELQDAKSQLTGGLLLSLEGSTHIMNRLARFELYMDHYVSVEETIAGIESVTAHDVLTLADELLAPERQSLAIIGPVDANDIV